MDSNKKYIIIGGAKKNIDISEIIIFFFALF
jgi:hypothetical protein